MLIDTIKVFSKTNSIAYRYLQDPNKQEYTYKELENDSCKIAKYLDDSLGDIMSPVVIYGHKSHLMIAAFIGVVKSGRAYCPIDINTPPCRLESIIESVNPSIIIAIEPLNMDCENIITAQNLLDIIHSDISINDFTPRIKPSDLYYIIYTSGSTGNPKGVMITYDNLNNFIDWGKTLIDVDHNTTIINQAPFSFDLSVMDLYIGLGTGSTIFTLDKAIQSDYKKLFEELSKSNATVFVATPSFIDLCLADRSFSQELMPYLKTFLFCGEVLTNKTCKRLKKRFPSSTIINTYGPTESTVAITSVVISDDVLENYEPLPIGVPKPGTSLHILDDNGEFITTQNSSGELIIQGNTLSLGYYKEPTLTRNAFRDHCINGNNARVYHTGDLGYMKDGMYFCSGRKDNQIKLHGYRIELGDIESNLSKVDGVIQCAVIPHYVKGKAERLTAYVVYNGDTSDNIALTMKIKEELQVLLQPYMIPQRFVYMDSLPMNANGKIDRKALGEMGQ